MSSCSPFKITSTNLKNVMSRSLLSPVPDNSTGALHDLPGVSLLVDLAETSPFTQLHVRVNLIQKRTNYPQIDDLNFI